MQNISTKLRRRGRPPARTAVRRRGVALVVVLLFIVALSALALSATFITANANLTSKGLDRESELRYTAEMGLAIGKSRVNMNPGMLPDSGYQTLMSSGAVTGADGAEIPGVKLNVYVGPSGSTSGQFGRFASVVADARDPQGNGFVRRLELAQESFAKFAYWSDLEKTPGGSTIFFGNGDQLWGPVYSNDVISIAASGASFHDVVETSQTISGVGNGTFFKGFKTKVKAITLPPMTLLSKLEGYAAPAGFSLTAPNSGTEAQARMRFEFIAADLDANGDSLGVDEGFFRVYTLASTAPMSWLRADWPGYSAPVGSVTQCGDWHVAPGGQSKFFPAAVHATGWFRALVQSGGLTSSAARAESSATLATIMGHANARCYLGGDPHLVAVQRTAAAYAAGDRQKGGDDTTFTPSDPNGSWSVFTTTPNVKVAPRYDARFLFPIFRGINNGSQGVIYVNGTTGVSGVLRGRITLYATGTIAILDDVRYANDPGLGNCQDMLGLIAGANVKVADNSVNTPQQLTSSGSSAKNLDDTKDLYLQAVIMALNTSFGVENHDAGPDNVNDCQGSDNGRGCLYLTGGVIQATRGAVGLLGGEGFVKRYSYDRCAATSPPPYFPTTGRFSDNRYYELDPVGFNVTNLFKAISSGY
jgi:hypothetical protein